MFKHLSAFLIATLLFLVFMTCIIFIFNFVMGKIIVGRSEVVVPELAGVEVDIAKKYLESVSLKIEIIDSEYHEFTEGLIVAQSPSKGRQIYKNRTIQVITSRGPKIISMPNLKGVSYQSVGEILRSYELKLGSVVQHYSDDVPLGFIIGTTPVPGTDIMAGIEVNIVLSIGRDPLDPVPIEENQSIPNLFDESFFDRSVF